MTNSGGVCVIDGERVSRTYDEKDGLKNNEILCIATGENGDILAGSNGGGLYVISKDGIREIGLDDGLRSGIVMRIRYDEKREVYWLVTSNSLAYMDRDYNVTSIKKFPYTNNFDMLLDREDNYWILSSNGLYVIPAEELMANGEMQPAHYGMKNGLSCVSTSNSYSALTEEGNLYVAGNTGVSVPGGHFAGSIAVTNSGGVCVIDGDRVSRTYDEKDGLKRDLIRSRCR